MDSEFPLVFDKSNRYNHSLLMKLSEAEIKNSELTAACLARDSEILRLENKIYELSSTLRNSEHQKSSQLISILTQTEELPNVPKNENIENFENEKKSLLLKIKNLEKSLENSESKCTELEGHLKSKEKEILKLKVQIKEQDSTNESMSFIKGNYTDRSMRNNNDFKDGASPRSFSHEIKGKSKSSKKLSVPKLSLITIINANNSNINVLKESPASERKQAYYSSIYKTMRNSPVKCLQKNFLSNFS
ncbi:unnamed protein product [Blepharisma stoltei]|uniref:Uncharacterized protein n=1 Tax=Blepharisma stoltei TaxID=1481888 RepID=A0AAU9J6G2_9CILI|nr:unnamed protein product [Blepharisma stoltei]